MTSTNGSFLKVPRATPPALVKAYEHVYVTSAVVLLFVRVVFCPLGMSVCFVLVVLKCEQIISTNRAKQLSVFALHSRLSHTMNEMRLLAKISIQENREKKVIKVLG